MAPDQARLSRTRNAARSHLEEALTAERLAEKNYHIREALQLLVVTD